MKRVLVSMVCGMIVLATVAGATVIRTMDRILPIVAGDVRRASHGVEGTVPSSSPGDTMGWTYYDYQHSGSHGKQIAHAGEGIFFFCWMCATDQSMAYRHVYFNKWIPDSGFRWPGNPPPGGIQVDLEIKAGYTFCDVLSDGRAVVAFHERVDPNPDAYYTVVAVEIAPCMGVFDVMAVDTFTWAPTNLDSTPIWPQVAVGVNDDIHVVAMNHAPAAGDPVFIAYSRSTDGGVSWEPWSILDTLIFDVSYVVQTSRLSQTVGIAYTAPREGIDPIHISQMSNDLYFWESEDAGLSWAVQRYNVTQWAEDDSFRCYTDCDLIYDDDDDVHFAFTVYHASGDTAFFPYKSMILHSDVDRNRSRVSGWGWPPDSMDGWWYTTGDPGAWRFPADRPSLGIDAGGTLHCIWIGCKDEDVSQGGYPNGDIYASASGPGYGPGEVWGCDHEPDSVWNLTNSETPGAIPGECDDDDYASLAEDVYLDTLHIFYINDKDAGGIPQEEGTPTDNPVIYLRHVAPRMDGVAEDEGGPFHPVDALELVTYPNPLHAMCAVRYTVPRSCRVDVSIYDACGRLVKRLVAGGVQGGTHHVYWGGCDADGARISAGIYFCRMTAGMASITQKIVVLR
jgi:hypothetical protein